MYATKVRESVCLLMVCPRAWVQLRNEAWHANFNALRLPIRVALGEEKTLIASWKGEIIVSLLT